MNNFLERYLLYTADTETPAVYNRWSAIVTVGALVGRNRWISFGSGKLFPNMYCMLMGDPGARKSSAIKTVKRLASQAGYENFSSDRSTREKFLLDLGGEEEDVRGFAKKIKGGASITEASLWGEEALKDTKEVYIVADEFNEFVSAGNVDFYTTLGTLWDWDDEDKPYTDKVKNSQSVSIYQPTISLLGGNTQENFARAFPPEILGHGFLSRLLLIHGAPSGRKIAFPTPPPADTTKKILSNLSDIIRQSKQEPYCLDIPPSSVSLFEAIYKEHPEIEDARFKGYNTRRYTHLLKLCIIIATCFNSRVLTEEIIVYANTVLAASEITMPLSIGEFGKSKNSDVAHKILTVLNSAKGPVPVKAIWAAVHKDLEKMAALSDILHNLQAADKVQHVIGMGGKAGWLPKKEVSKAMSYVNWNLLSEEERKLT